MGNYAISINTFGPHAILIEWPEKVDEFILDDILQFLTFLKNGVLAGSEWELVPAYNSLTLIQRNSAIDFALTSKKLFEWYEIKGNTLLRQKFLWRLPVCYEEEFGIDLQYVSEQLGQSVDELVALHTQSIYTVYGIGFLPGFMYLGGLPAALEVPRRAVPRLKVKKGAVGLAGKQTGIYPQESPGGWNIIGNCSVPIFDVRTDPPCFVSVGDKVQFYEISRAEYDLHKIESEVGIYKLEKIKIDA